MSGQVRRKLVGTNRFSSPLLSGVVVRNQIVHVTPEVASTLDELEYVNALNETRKYFEAVEGDPEDVPAAPEEEGSAPPKRATRSRTAKVTKSAEGDDHQDGDEKEDTDSES